MGEAGEDTSWNSFMERFWRGSGWTSRSLVAEYGEERGEVGKKERRKKKEEESVRPNRYNPKDATLVGVL
jgi:hypothetical protein